MLKILWTIAGCLAAVVFIGFLIGVSVVAIIRLYVSIKANKKSEFFVLDRRVKPIKHILPGDFFYKDMYPYGKKMCLALSEIHKSEQDYYVVRAIIYNKNYLNIQDVQFGAAYLDENIEFFGGEIARFPFKLIRW